MSINDGIPKDSYLGEAVNLKYPTIDMLAHRLYQLGKNVKQFKVDIRAFRQIPLDPSSWRFTGMYWKKKFFLDKITSMGLGSAALFFQRLQMALSSS